MIRRDDGIVEDMLGDASPVDGVTHCLSYPLVLEVGVMQVEGQQPDMMHVPLEPLKSLINQLVLAVGGWNGDDVHLARLQSQDARRRIRQWPNDDAVEVGFLAPVALEALEHRALVGDLFHELEGARADG